MWAHRRLCLSVCLPRPCLTWSRGSASASRLVFLDGSQQSVNHLSICPSVCLSVDPSILGNHSPR
ncbi:hypothetical protein CGRA01v4_09390 [Colletotrichum graminicola]|nr:hypothetical protein CGRA01v4_09390 [Colletotrichum graminicola]